MNTPYNYLSSLVTFSLLSPSQRYIAKLDARTVTNNDIIMLLSQGYKIVLASTDRLNGLEIVEHIDIPDSNSNSNLSE